MIQLWEADAVNDSNCGICDNSEPFFIPVAYTDFIALRLNIPYVQVEDNGGGLPTSFKIEIFEYNGNTMIDTYGTTASGKFLYEYINDLDNRIAEYKMILPQPFADVDNVNYKVYYFPVSSGDKIKLDVNGTIYYFRYGLDETPFPLIEYKSGRLCIGISNYDYGFTTLTINGTPTSLTNIVTTALALSHYPDCFRLKVTITFSTAGVTNVYYTKTFKMLNECENTVLVEAQYPTAAIDSAGHDHQQNGTTFHNGKLWMRFHADLEREKSKLKVSMNSRCYVYKSERVQMFRMKSDPFPQWMGQAFETLCGGQYFLVDGQRYYIEDVENVLTDSDVPGSNYQNIDLPLQQCKYENVFVC